MNSEYEEFSQIIACSLIPEDDEVFGYDVLEQLEHGISRTRRIGYKRFALACNYYSKARKSQSVSEIEEIIRQNDPGKLLARIEETGAITKVLDKLLLQGQIKADQ